MDAMKILIEGFFTGIVACGACALFGWPIWIGFIAIVFVATRSEESEMDKAIREMDREYRKAGIFPC